MFKKIMALAATGLLLGTPLYAQQANVGSANFTYDTKVIVGKAAVRVNFEDIPDLPEARILPMHPQQVRDEVKLKKVGIG